jgi:hypothetical protein
LAGIKVFSSRGNEPKARIGPFRNAVGPDYSTPIYRGISNLELEKKEKARNRIGFKGNGFRLAVK